MTKLVRVQNENGMESTVSEDYAELAGLKVLTDVAAVDGRGQALVATRAGGRPALPRTNLDEASARKLNKSALLDAVEEANLSAAQAGAPLIEVDPNASKADIVAAVAGVNQPSTTTEA